MTAYSDEYDSIKQTALHYSMTNTSWGVMETLVKAGVDVNRRRIKDGWTPLFLASIFGYSYKAKYLVDAGADVLLADNVGWTAEDWAEKYGLPAVVKIIRYGEHYVADSEEGVAGQHQGLSRRALAGSMWRWRRKKN